MNEKQECGNELERAVGIFLLKRTIRLLSSYLTLKTRKKEKLMKDDELVGVLFQS